MKKSTKGALAAGGAAVLLLGGAGTLAFWTAETDLDGGDVTSGELRLENAACDADWVYAEGAASEGETVELFVPGDVITKDCTFDIVATGDNLSATLTVPDTAEFGTVEPAAASLTADVTATYVDGVGAALPATISEDDSGPVTATLTVTFPFGTDETGTPQVNANDTQDVTATLDAITVSLVQIDPN